MTDHDKIKSAALLADRIEHSAKSMMLRSTFALKDGDFAGAAREQCIAAREFDWAADLWDAINWQGHALRCRELANAVRAGEYTALPPRAEAK